MSEKQDKFRRRFLRAPIYGDILYGLDGFVLKGQIKNVSEGGLCIGELSKIPESSFISITFALPLYPELSHVDEKFLSFQDVNQFDTKVLKSKIKIVRSFEGEDRLDGIFLKEIGCEFVDLSFESKSLLTEYVFTYSKNLSFLLNLFEKTNLEETNETLKWCASFLGYDAKAQLPKLRQKILHDYQSIKSL